MDYPTRLDFCDGKYTVIYDFSTGQSECLRYGQPWRQLVGDKMVLAMFDRVVELQAENAALKAELAAETKKFEAAITTNERLLSDVRCANYELAAAQKDAERYRWLRSPDRGMANLSTVINDDCQPPYYELKCGTELDAAIDKELAK